jgi:putative redox protein
MTTKSATVQLTEGMAFRATADSGQSVLLDSSADGGGTGQGPTPMELLLMALGGCTAMDVISILRKMRQDVTDYRVEVRGERAETHPKVYTSLEVVHVVTGHGVSREQAQRAIDLSAGTYCSVSAMLGASATVTHRLELVEAVRA